MHLIKSWHFILAFLQEPRSGENFKNSIGIADISPAARKTRLKITPPSNIKEEEKREIRGERRRDDIEIVKG